MLVGLVAEDADVRRRFAELLAGAGIRIAAEAEDAPTLAATLGREAPDAIVVAPLDTPGITVQVRALRRRFRKVPLVAVLPSTDAAECRRAISAGADGAVLDRELERTLAVTVAAAAVGQISFPGGLRGTVDGPPLTVRQRQVLSSMAIGLTNAQIAERLGLSESTVKSHLSSAFTKLGVASRAEAAALIRQRVDAVDPEGAQSGDDVATG
jgi:DNA-binding NarL/FixJ family response regulator